MTVILVLFTFVGFLAIDYIRTRKEIVIRPAVVVAKAAKAVRAIPDMVAGFRLPANLSYHPGHTWALSESPNLVRVGCDDFASKLVGNIDHVKLPQRGQWVRQGQKIASFSREGATVDMISPIEGSISDVNDNLMRNPRLVKDECYGEGWLVTVQSPDAKTNFRNLLSGAVARFWLQESAGRLQARMPMYAGALAQDGGVAVGNLAEQIPNNEWTTVAKEFFLS